MFKYFDGKLSSGFVALYSGRMIQAVSEGLTALFVPIFLLKVFNLHIEYVLLYYALGYFLYFFFLPPGAQLLNKIGLRRSLRMSVFINCLIIACYYFVHYNPVLILGLSLVFLTIYRIFFWIPYHTDFAKFSDRLNRAKELSLMEATRSLIGIMTPAVAGLLIASMGFNYVFVIAIVVQLASSIPFILLPHTQEKFSWSIRETYRQFFCRANRKLVLANVASGAESAASGILWPLFIWQILNGNYFAVGAVSSLITLIAVVVQLAAGRYADKMDKRRIMRWGSLLDSAGWLVKIYVATGFQIFIVGTYHSFTSIFKSTPFDALTYELMADQGHYVDEFSVLKEMSIQLGRVLLVLLAFFMVGYVDLNWTFILAAIASICVNFL